MRKGEGGLAGVEVYFVDTGLDQASRKKPEEHLIGRTDASGNLAADWKYFWGYSHLRFGQEEPDPSEQVPGTFELVFKTDGLVQARRDFKLWSLKRRGKEYLVPFEVNLS